MPSMTLLGWFHTLMGVAALLLAAVCVWRYRIIRSSDKEGALYLIVTTIVAGSALAIYNQGGFGIAHILALLTLAAVAGGFIMEKTQLLGGLSKYCHHHGENPVIGWVIEILSSDGVQCHGAISHDSCHHRFSATPAGG